MDTGERATGTPNEEYNLVSVLYHALHGAETCEMYALDADRAGNDELASFFRNVQATHRQVAEQARAQLGIGGVSMPGTAEVGTSIPPEGTTRPKAPPTPSNVRRGNLPEAPPRTGYVSQRSPRPGEDVPPPQAKRGRLSRLESSRHREVKAPPGCIRVSEKNPSRSLGE
jgi:hypothetical protein